MSALKDNLIIFLTGIISLFLFTACFLILSHMQILGKYYPEIEGEADINRFLEIKNDGDIELFFCDYCNSSPEKLFYKKKKYENVFLTKYGIIETGMFGKLKLYKGEGLTITFHRELTVHDIFEIHTNSGYRIFQFIFVFILYIVFVPKRIYILLSAVL